MSPKRFVAVSILRLSGLVCAISVFVLGVNIAGSMGS